MVRPPDLDSDDVELLARAAVDRSPEREALVHVGGYRIMYEVSEDTVRVWSLGRAPR